MFVFAYILGLWDVQGVKRAKLVGAGVSGIKIPQDGQSIPGCDSSFAQNIKLNYAMLSVIARADHVCVVDKDVPSDEWSNAAKQGSEQEPEKHCCAVLSNCIAVSLAVSCKSVAKLVNPDV